MTGKQSRAVDNQNTGPSRAFTIKVDMGMLKELLKPLAEDGAALTREQAAAVLEEILAGACLLYTSRCV